MNKYVFNVRLCEGIICGQITITADNEDEATEFAICYICDKLAKALPELDIPVTVELEDVYLK